MEKKIIVVNHPDGVAYKGRTKNRRIIMTAKDDSEQINLYFRRLDKNFFNDIEKSPHPLIKDIGFGISHEGALLLLQILADYYGYKLTDIMD